MLSFSFFFNIKKRFTGTWHSIGTSVFLKLFCLYFFLLDKISIGHSAPKDKNSLIATWLLPLGKYFLTIIRLSSCLIMKTHHRNCFPLCLCSFIASSCNCSATISVGTLPKSIESKASCWCQWGQNNARWECNGRKQTCQGFHNCVAVGQLY